MSSIRTKLPYNHKQVSGHWHIQEFRDNDYDYQDWSGDIVDTSIIGISLGTGYTHLDSDWQVEDDVFGEISLGFYFTPSFSIALNYAREHLHDLQTSERLTYENYSVNGRYYFMADQTFRPYLTARLGWVK